jgi:hypothetical protein
MCLTLLSHPTDHGRPTTVFSFSNSLMEPEWQASPGRFQLWWRLISTEVISV